MQHGAKNFVISAPRSRSYEGGFGRLFPDLRPWWPEGVKDHELEEHFLKFASDNMVEFPGRMPEDLAAADTADAAGMPGGENSTLPSGYVYFGQFVDHDLTLDTTPLSDAELDPNRLQNFRTPRLDLDNIYGQGPDAQPHLYEHDNGAITGKLLVGEFRPGRFPEEAPNGFSGVPGELRDLQRNAENRALIGDPRNDENAIVSQIHLAFVLAHNRLVDRAHEVLGEGSSPAQRFEAARKSLRWLYQWIVWNDFIRRIAKPIARGTALMQDRQPDGRLLWKLGYKDDVYDWKNQPFMPVEFSVAAYRFGHSLVRNAYQTNVNGIVAGFNKFHPIFRQNGETSLRGSRPLDLRRIIQWDWFLHMQGGVAPFPQRARRFDEKLSNALSHMPEDPVAPGDPTKLLNVLAARNLVRGVRMGLPSGEDVARQLGVPIVPLTDAEPRTLWYYLLKEAGAANHPAAAGDGPFGDGISLGIVGSILVCATFAGILKGDALSWFNQEPEWTPGTDPLLGGLTTPERDPNRDQGVGDNVSWGLPAIVRLSGLPVNAVEFAGVVANP